MLASLILFLFPSPSPIGVQDFPWAEVDTLQGLFTLDVDPPWAVAMSYHARLNEVHVLERKGVGWSIARTLDKGTHAAIDGQRVVLGRGPGERFVKPGEFEFEPGKAHFYEFLGGQWQETAVFSHPDLDFGRRVDIDGDRAVVLGAPRMVGDPASLFVYFRGGGGWQLEDEIDLTDLAMTGYFGDSIDLSGEDVVIGNVDHSRNNVISGGAHIYSRAAGGSWSKTATLDRSDPEWFDEFGMSVAIDGDWLAVGAPGRKDRGRVYVYQRTGPGVWVERAELEADLDLLTTPDPGAPLGVKLTPRFGYFGLSVDIDGDRLIAGDSSSYGFHSTPYHGEAYVFRRHVDGSWLRESRLQTRHPTDFSNSPWESFPVSLRGDQAVMTYQTVSSGTAASFFEFGCPSLASNAAADQPDVLEPNDEIATASDISLARTVTFVEEKVEDLTLDDAWDIDTFRIQFDFDPDLACSMPVSSWPLTIDSKRLGPPLPGTVFELGGGGPDIWEGTITLRVQDEFCMPFDLSVRHSDGSLFAHYPDQIEAVVVECPTSIFKDQTLLLSVKNSQGVPRRYSLFVTTSNRGIFKPPATTFELRTKLPDVLEGLEPRPPEGPLELFYDPAEFLAQYEAFGRARNAHVQRLEDADLYHELGRMAQAMGQVGQASEYYARSMESYQRAEVPTGQARGLAHLGELALLLHNTDLAHRQLTQAEEILAGVGAPLAKARVQVLLARVERARKSPAEALKLLEGASAVQLEQGDMEGWTMNQAEQARAFAELEDPAAAVACIVLIERQLERIQRSARLPYQRARDDLEALVGKAELSQLRWNVAGREQEVREAAMARYRD